MRAVRVSKFGGFDMLRVENEVPVPEPSKNQVLIEVKAAGVNPIDTYIIGGSHSIKPTLPYTPGFDIAGIVKTVGPGVKRFQPGERVYAVRTVSGAFAEYAVADDTMCGHLDGKVSFEQGAGIGIPCYTAYRSVVTLCEAKTGQSILIHGASGAIAKSRGLNVIGTAGSQEGIDLVLKQGATAAFNHNESGYTDKIIEATGGKGPDIIIEMLASVNIEKDLQIINTSGTIAIVGSRGPFTVDKKLTKEKGINIKDVSILKAPVADYMIMHEAIEEGLKAGWLRPYVCKAYGMEEAGLAFDEQINAGKSLGKRVIKI